jgi:hypothetical protein
MNDGFDFTASLLSTDQVRTISYWLEAGGGYGGLHAAKCRAKGYCGVLCKAQLIGIHATDLAKGRGETDVHGSPGRARRVEGARSRARDP